MTTPNNEPPCIDIGVDVEQASAPIPPTTPPEINDHTADVLSQDLGSSTNAIADLLSLYLNLNQQPNANIRWTMLAKVLIGVTLVIVLAIIVAFSSTHERRRGGNGDDLGCFIYISVSKDNRKSNFTTISDAVEASPDYSPFKVCIFVGAGEYRESVIVDHQKKNIALIGEGMNKTVISSNTTSDGFLGPDFWSAATLSAFGDNFVAQDLTVRSTSPYGVAVKNKAENSNFFRCRFEGNNATVHIKAGIQFYRDCQFYGKNYLVYGYARAYFQKCQFLSKKSYADENTVFFSQSSRVVDHRAGFVFHLCDFDLIGRYANNSKTAFLGGSSGDHTFVAIIQSYVDPSLAGYLFGIPTDSTYYAIFLNSGLDSTAENVPSFVHLLQNVQDASRYSLRNFLDGGKYIAKGVEYDLDLVK